MKWVGHEPVHQVEIHIWGVEIFEGLVDTSSDPVMPRVVELGGQEDLISSDSGILDTLTDLSLVAVGESTARVVRTNCCDV